MERSVRISRLLAATVVALASLLSAPAALAQGAEAFDEASGLYRAGEWASAETLWLEALAQAPGPDERARLCGNLAATAARQGDPHSAVAWYTAALRLRPRDGAFLRDLELVRAQAGLEPHDDGSLSAALSSWARDWTASEARWLAALGLGALALGALAEALRGGRNGRTALFAALLLQPILLAPVTRQALAPEDAPWMVVQSGGVLARAEPRPDASRQAHFAAGDELAVVDRWPGWLMVEGPEGVGVWVPEGALFALDR